MQTAITNETISFTFNPTLLAGSAFQVPASFTSDPIFYFAEYSTLGSADTEQFRDFRLECSDLFEPLRVDTSTTAAFNALQYSIGNILNAYPTFSRSSASTTCRLTRNSMLNPVISAFEVFTVQVKATSVTSDVDGTDLTLPNLANRSFCTALIYVVVSYTLIRAAAALAKVGADFQLSSLWVGDPCLPDPWDGIQCQSMANSSTIYQVSAM